MKNDSAEERFEAWWATKPWPIPGDEEIARRAYLAADEILRADNARLQRVGEGHMRVVAGLQDQINHWREESTRLQRIIDKGARHWIALQVNSPIKWEGDLGEAMGAACAEIARLQRELEEARKDRRSPEDEKAFDALALELPERVFDDVRERIRTTVGLLGVRTGMLESAEKECDELREQVEALRRKIRTTA